MAQQINDNYFLAGPKKLDDKSGVFEMGVWRPFYSVAEACAKVPIDYRAPTQEAWIQPQDKSSSPVEYIWLDSVEDSGLVPKPGGGEMPTWDSILDKPTTLAGFGITDALVKTVNGNAPDAQGNVVIGVEQGTVTWGAITDKPATFPADPHTHAWDSVTGKPTTFTPSTHQHPMSDVTGLAAALAAKAETIHTHTFASLTSKPTTLGGYGITDGVKSVNDVPADSAGNVTVEVPWEAVTAKPVSFPPSAHGHDWSEISNRPASFPVDPHSHTWGEITEKPTTFPPSAHTTLWEEIMDKPATFPPSAHNHTWAQIIDKPITFTPTAHVHQWSEIENKPTAFPPEPHTQAWVTITQKPALFPPEAHTHAWEEVTDKPASFTPATHGHSWSEISDKPTINGNGPDVDGNYSVTTEGEFRYPVDTPPIPVTLSGGKTAGRYVSGQSIPVAGKTEYEIKVDMYNEFISGTISMTLSPATTTYEVGETPSINISGSIATNSETNITNRRFLSRLGTSGAFSQVGTFTGGSYSFSGNTPTATTTYRAEFTNTQNNVISTERVVNFDTKHWYGPYSAAPSASQARTLSGNGFRSANTGTLNTGTVERRFYILVAPGRKLSAVTDLDASNANVTGFYTLQSSNASVNNAAGGAVSGYKLYEMVAAVPYETNHRHSFTIIND